MGVSRNEQFLESRAPSQYPKRRLSVRSHKVSKPRDWYFKLPYRFEIWQAHRQQRCRSVCQISQRSDNSKYKSRGFETLRDLTERRLFGYWDGVQDLLLILVAHCLATFEWHPQSFSTLPHHSRPCDRYSLTMAAISDLDQTLDGRGTYSTFDEDSSFSDETFTAEKAIECIGFGRFQVFVGLGASLSWIADSIELMVISILGPVLICEWGTTVYEEALITTLVFSGMLVGSPLLGWIADVYGRRRGLLLTCTWITVTGILSALAPNFYWFLIFRFLVGIGIAGDTQSVTYLAEFLPNRSRGRCVVLVGVFFAIGASLAVLLAICILMPYGWRWWLVACAMPSFVFVVFCLVFGYWLEWFPRSPCYDLITGNSENAFRTLQMAARWNKTKLPEGKLISGPEVPRGHIFDLLRPGYRVISFLLVILWFLAGFSYYGIALFITQMITVGNTCDPYAFGFANNGTCHILNLNDYNNLLLTTTADIPGLVVAAILVDVIGRKRSFIITSMLYAITCLFLFICMQKTPMVIVLYFARTLIDAPAQILFVYTAEVYPTEVRALGMGFGSMMARVGAMVTPFAAQVLLSFYLYYALGVYVSLGFLFMVTAVWLPLETKGMSLKSHGWYSLKMCVT